MPILIHQIINFGVIGTIGFIVYTLILYLLKDFTGLILGRLISFFVAVLTTWVLNRNITFKQNTSQKHLLKEFWYYRSAMIVGGGFN